jgi:hypothetical protein
LNTTVLVAFKVPSVGFVVFETVNVAPAETSTEPVTAKPEGIVKLRATEPSPTTILEFDPSVHDASKVTSELAMFQLMFAVLRAGAGPPVVPAALVPQSARVDTDPPDFR